MLRSTAIRGEVNSQWRIRTILRAPDAQSVLLDIGGVRYPMAKGEDGVWTGVSNAQDEGFHYYQLNVDGVSVPDPGTVMFYGATRRSLHEFAPLLFQK